MWDDEELLKILFAFISFSNELLSHLVSKAGKTEPYKTSEKLKSQEWYFVTKIVVQKFYKFSAFSLEFQKFFSITKQFFLTEQFW